MSTKLIIELLVFLILMAISTLLSRGEAALVMISRHWFEQGLERRKRNGLAEVLARRGELSLAILSARTFVDVGAISLAAVIVSSLLAHRGLLIWLLVEIVVLGSIYLIVVETLPRLVILRKSAEVAPSLVRMLELLRWLLLPLIKLLQRLTSGRATELTVDTTAFSIKDDELKVAMEVEEDKGLLEEEEREMIHSIFEFGETQVKEVMIPRIDMVCIDSKQSPQKAMEIIVRSGHSRIPVFEDKIDHIVGLLYAKDLLRPMKEGQSDFRILDLAREVYFVPETKMINELLKEFQTRRMHMAIVVDEYGGTAGLITLEDILEEIVGEIRDEYDIEEDLVKVLDKRTAEVSAKVNLHDLNEELGLELPDEEFDTLGGFIYHLAGAVPHKGDQLEYKDLQFIIQEVGGQRVSKVKIVRTGNQEGAQKQGE